MAHIHALIDFTVTVFIINDSKVLLVNHPRYNKWLPIGGHIELDEDPEQALYREILEESGLKCKILGNKPDIQNESVKSLLSPRFMDVHDAGGGHKHISLVYFASTNSPDFKLSEEHSDMRWFTISDLDDNQMRLSPLDTLYAKAAIKAATII